MKGEFDFKKLKPRPGKVKFDKDAAKVPISIRVDGGVLADLKSEAKRLGLPYQTHVSSVLHQYVSGELIQRKTVELLKKVAGD